MKTIKAAFWDMDGTIIDSEPFWIKARKTILEKYHKPWDPEYDKQFLGKPIEFSAEYLQKHSNIPLTKEEIVDFLVTKVRDLVKETTIWMPGSRELLAEFKANNIPNVLVTMSYTNLVDTVVSQLPENTFTEIISGNNVTKHKPDPEAYLLGLKALNEKSMTDIKNFDCVAFEDSNPGVLSSHNAGMVTIAVPYSGVTIPPLPKTEIWGTLENKTLFQVTETFREFS